MFNNVQNSGNLNAIYPKFKLDPDSNAGKVVKIDEPFSKQLVITRSGDMVKVPVMMGSSIRVKALDDGTYQVTTQGAYKGAKKQTEIMTEAQLVEKFGNNKSKFHTVG